MFDKTMTFSVNEDREAELKKNLTEIKSQFIQTISGGGISDGN